MISSAKSNMYEVNALSTLAVYGDFMHANPNCTLLALSTQGLSKDAHNALESSAAALGYGSQSCAFAVTSLSADTTLGAKDLMSMVEGLDPLALVITDGDAAGLFARAYRVSLAADAACHVLGRPLVAFHNFESLLSNPDGKQRAWALLKKLPKIS